MLDLSIDLTGRVALVTAAAGSIGTGVVRALARCGASLALNDVDDVALAAVVAEVGGLRLQGDAGDFETVHGLVERAVQRLGVPFVLVNIAGVGHQKNVVEMTEADWDLVQTANLKSAFNWCHAVLPYMLSSRGGRVINISSVAGKKGGHNNKAGRDSRGAYAAAKAGVMGLTRGLALEVAPAVTVNAICPGLVPNPRNRDAIETRWPLLVDDYIMGRVGTGDDIAKAVLYFISADWVTGEITDVNGGYYID